MTLCIHSILLLVVFSLNYKLAITSSTSVAWLEAEGQFQQILRLRDVPWRDGLFDLLESELLV